MAFRFPLQALLHLRQSLEHQQELRLKAANQQVARIRHAIEQVDIQVSRVRRLATRELASGTTSAELRFTAEIERALQSQRHHCEDQLSLALNLRNQQQLIFQQARRERETFESLRNQQLLEYEREAARKQQRQLDDLFLLRRAYLRHG